MTPPALSTNRTLAPDVAQALRTGELDPLVGRQPVDRRDRFLTLLTVYDLHTAPLEQVGDAARHQGHPAVADVKTRLEAAWLAELELAWSEAGRLEEATTPERAVTAMRAVAARDRLPAAYKWLADTADWEQLVDFLALEGGPDGGFDDLVSACQVGLSGSAKLELAQNYWDEMGNGDPDAVHTVLHERLVEAVAMPRIPRGELPVEALERAALGGLLATNRWLQPEMLGALGLLELQAGPRCRLVLKAFDRLGAPAAAYPFYVEHAEVDPRHGKDWVEKAIVPTVAERPEWGPRIVKGAWWRSSVNLGFFASLHLELTGERARPAA
ncbi:MAG: hypothetical protein JWN87_803 [Frankiales bacterium]|nr:hypothetical protein [Frankiales bacterium]